MKASPLVPGRSLPLLIEPENADQSTESALTSWLAEATAIDNLLCRHGALLLRGFSIRSDAAFARTCEKLTPQLRAYVGGDSPRHRVLENVYTSSEYPSHLEVRLHNELSYGVWWPSRVFFYCHTNAMRGGETHIADGRDVYRRMPAAIKHTFAERGVRYLQHLPDAEYADGDKSWQETFDTDSRAAVEAHCRRANMQYDWTAKGLRTSISRPAVLRHQVTGEWVWFNQVDQWHAALASVKHSAGEGRDQAMDPAAHATFGDGTEIDVEHLRAVRRVCAECEVVYPWREADVLVLDNVLTMHGRKPYQGDRRVLVAMG